MEDLRKLRGTLGLSQNEFAILLGIDQSLIARWELGERNLSAEVLTRMDEMDGAINIGEIASSADVDGAHTESKSNLLTSINKQLSQKSIELQSLHLDLKRMQHIYKESFNALIILIPERRIFQNVRGYKKQLDAMTIPRIKLLAENSLKHQQIQAIRIASVEADIASLQTQLNVITPG